MCIFRLDHRRTSTLGDAATFRSFDNCDCVQHVENAQDSRTNTKPIPFPMYLHRLSGSGSIRQTSRQKIGGDVRICFRFMDYRGGFIVQGGYWTKILFPRCVLSAFPFPNVGLDDGWNA